MIHENMSFHCSLLLAHGWEWQPKFILSLIPQWDWSECWDSLQGKILPPATLYCCCIFFSGAMQASQLFQQITEAVRFQLATNLLFFQLLMSLHSCGFLTLRISFLSTSIFHDISLPSKSLSEGLAIQMFSWRWLSGCSALWGRVFSSV